MSESITIMCDCCGLPIAPKVVQPGDGEVLPTLTLDAMLASVYAPKRSEKPRASLRIEADHLHDSCREILEAALDQTRQAIIEKVHADTAELMRCFTTEEV